MSEKIAAVLDKAADVIEERGLANGVFWDGHPMTKCPVCTWGALSLLTNGKPVPPSYSHDASMPALRALSAYLNLPEPRPTNAFGVADWNDAPERTADEVIAALRAAAASERAS